MAIKSAKHIYWPRRTRYVPCSLHSEATGSALTEPTYPKKLVVLARTHSFSESRQTLTRKSDVIMGNTCSVDVTSTESSPDIATLVHSPSKIIDARNLRGDQAQRLVNLLDQVGGLDKRLIPRVTMRNPAPRVAAPRRESIQAVLTASLQDLQSTWDVARLVCCPTKAHSCR